MSRRGWLVAALGLVVLVVLVVLAPTPPPPWSITSTASDGTDMLRRILEQDFDVTVVETGPMATIDDRTSDDLVVVFEDRLDPADEAAIGDHVAAGGRAIVAVPGQWVDGVVFADFERALRGAPECDVLPGTRVGPRPGPYDDAAIDARLSPHRGALGRHDRMLARG